MSVPNYPSSVPCRVCPGELEKHIGGQGPGVLRQEYRCPECGHAGCIRASDGKRIGPVFTGRATTQPSTTPTEARA